MTRSLKEAKCASLKAFRENKSTRRKTPGQTTCPPGIRLGKCPPWCHASARGMAVAGCGLVPGVSAAPRPRKTAGGALRAFSTCFSSSRGKQGNEAALHGDPAPLSTSPRSYFAGGHALAQRAVGGPGMEALGRPRRAGCSGQQLPPLERIPPAPCPGAAPSLPEAQRPHHAHTDNKSTPWAARSPITGQSREGRGRGVGRGRGPAALLLGPRAGHRLGSAPATGSSSAAPRRQDPCFPPTASASEQTSSTAALGAERRVSSQGAAAAPRAREGRGGGVPFPRPGPRPWGSQS